MALRSFASCARSKVALDHAAGGVPGRGSFPRDAGVAWELAFCGALVLSRAGVGALSDLAWVAYLGACFMGEKGFPRGWRGALGSGGYVLRLSIVTAGAPLPSHAAGDLPFAAVQAPFLMHVAGNLPNAAGGAPFLMHVAGNLPNAAVRAPFLMRLAGDSPNATVGAPKLLRLAGGPPFAAVQAPFLMHVAGGPPFAAVRAPKLMRLAGNLPNAAVRAPKLLRLANGLHACFRRFVADCSCGEHMAYTFAS